MIAVWGKNKSTKNTTLGFSLSFPQPCNFSLKLCAATVFQVFVDGVLQGFGPNRTAKDYARLSTYQLNGKHLVVKVHHHGINSYAYIKQNPFFAAEIKTFGGQLYSSQDFDCFHLNDRVQKVARYSYQRGFSEVYSLDHNPKNFLLGEALYQKVELIQVELPSLLESGMSYPRLDKLSPVLLEEGIVSARVDEVEKWRPNFISLVGEKLEGYQCKDWEENPLDEIATLTCLKTFRPSRLSYRIFDFTRSVTGFFSLNIETSKSGPVYLLFDELMSINNNNKCREIDYQRNNTNNILKWTLNKPNKYSVMTLEPYTARYIRIIAPSEAKITVKMILLENSEIEKTKFLTDDRELNLIFEAAKNTLAQNAIDILMDCPSRERAGWLADSYFSSTAELYLTGSNKVEHAFLENFTLSKNETLPKGMIPMVYPSDDYDGVFIPNWSLWYILELAKYARLHKNDNIIVRSLEKVRGILDYFSTFENEFGLLEDLESWVFVEWSSANNLEHTRGVNIPTNALYAKALVDASELLADDLLLQKAKVIQKNIKKIGFDGYFFVDNLVRNIDGHLIKSSNYTEVCQYYLFWTDCINSEEYPRLYLTLINKLGPNRTNEHQHIEKPNMMYGIYMRLDLLLRENKRAQLLNECKHYFLSMAETTNTLWENNLPTASCNHAFASYSVRWIIFGLSGLDLLASNKKFSQHSIGISGEIILPNSDHTSLYLVFDQKKVRMQR